MRSLFLSIDENYYNKLVNFLKLFPQNKLKIEEIPCSPRLAKELRQRKKEMRTGHVLFHRDIWSKARV